MEPEGPNKPTTPIPPADYTDVPPPPAPPSAGQAPVEQPAPEIPQSTPVPEPVAPQSIPEPVPQTQIPQDQVIAPPSEGRERKFPVKILLIALSVLVATGAVAFGVKTFLGKQALPPKEVTLTYWGLWEDSTSLQGLISEYEASHPGVKINYIKQAKDDYRERLVSSLARSTPDIFRYHNTWVPTLSTSLSSLPPEIMSPEEFQNTFYPVASQDLRRGTDIVGMPLMFDGLGLYINEEIFEKAGKSPPSDWNQLKSLAQELTVKNEQKQIEQAGVALGRTDNVDHWEDILGLMMLQNGVDMSRPTGTQAEDALSFFTLFAKNGLVWDETLPPSTQAFAGGKLAMYFGPSWRAFEIKQLNPNLRFKVVPVPQLPKNQPGEADITRASYWAEGVSNKSENQKAAWEFLKFLSQKESLQKMYEQAAKTRVFGEIYPRPDMAQLLENDPLVGAYVRGAKTSRSWYLASRTFDGPTGINSRLSAYFADAINGMVNGNKTAADVLPTVASGVAQVLSEYRK